MGKLALWVLIAVAVMLILRMIASSKRRPRDDAETGGSGGGARQPKSGEGEQRDAGELILACAVCGTHVPSSDAVFARGKVFCGPDHRDQYERQAGAKVSK